MKAEIVQDDLRKIGAALMKTRNAVLLAVLAGALTATSTMATFVFDSGPTTPVSLTRPGQAGNNYTLGNAPSWFDKGNMTYQKAYSHYVFDGAIGGYMESWVFANPTVGSTFGDLGFMYSWHVTGGPALNQDIKTVVMGGAAAPWANVHIADAGSTTGVIPISTAMGGGWTDGSPHTMTRDAGIGGSGITVYWLPGSTGTMMFGPSQYSADVWFVTDAESYGMHKVDVQDSASSSLAYAYQPVPEPGMLARAGMIGLGLLGFWGYRRNKR